MTSVTFPTAIGGDGSTVSDDDNATTGLRNGGWRTRFIPCFTNLVNIADYMVSYTAQTSTFASPPPMGSTTPNTGKFTTLTTTGNVGVGIASPGGRLDVAGTTTLGTGSGSPIVLRISDLSTGDGGAGTWSTTTDFTQLQFYSADASGPGGANPRYSIGAVMANSVGSLSALTFRSWSSGADTERMRLDAGGNLGLGVIPSAWAGTFGPALQINKLTIAQNGGFDISVFTTNGYATSGSAYAYIGAAAATQYRQYAGQHQWFNAPVGAAAGDPITFTHAMTLNAGGSLLVGTTSTGFGNQNSFAWDAPGKYAIINHQNGTASGTGYVLFGYNGSGIGSITQNGTTGVLYNTSSDQRLKTNITPAGSAIQSILDFPVDQFDWISTDEHQEFGAVAQKAINFIPEMVSVPADENEMWGIDWSKAVPRLIKTIQELSAELNELKKSIN